MARIDDLLAQITEPELQTALVSAVDDLRARGKFGLVFEEHLPELIALPGLPIRVGDLAFVRSDSQSVPVRVTSISDSTATIEPRSGGGHRTLPLSDLFAVKRSGEPVYPALTPIGSTSGPGAAGPRHAVINGENYHALQLLRYLFAGRVDCIYIDPPYNTGARDWTYNNCYVDENDSWRHSKWLSMMKRRLILAKELLRSDGVLVVTIDEHEVHHLRMLIDQIFPEFRRQMVTIVNNAAGVSQGGFYRVEEYALFAFRGGSAPAPSSDDLLSDESTKKSTQLWFSHIRYGGTNDVPSKRPGLVYPIGIDPETLRVVGTGPTLEERVVSGNVQSRARADLDAWQPDPDETLAGLPVVWPFRADGSLATWQTKPETLQQLVSEGFVRVRRHPNGPGFNMFSVSYVKAGHRDAVVRGEIEIRGREAHGGALILGDLHRRVVPKTVWRRSLHDAGKWGKRVLRELLGQTNFDYPKSPYAVLDTLRSCIGERPDALILDFFAGSGTTLHSTLMLNREDGGLRRCILVTNNAVSAPDQRALRSVSEFPGDPTYEAKGIFEAVTRPRCEAAVSGRDADGVPLTASYEDATPYSSGFAAHVDFFRLDYLDPDTVELGQRFDAIHASLRMVAGGEGTGLGDTPDGAGFMMPDGARYAVLFREASFADFLRAIRTNKHVTHTWLVTNSDQAFAEMCELLPSHLEVSMLYRDYLRNFEINTSELLR